MEGREWGVGGVGGGEDVGELEEDVQGMWRGRGGEREVVVSGNSTETYLIM